MQTVLIVIHLMVVIALVGVVLLQRSEGGGLGIGGGSGFMTARGAANALTRATGILAMAFFVTSLTLSLLARYGDRPIDILDQPPAAGENGGGQGGGVLDQLGGGDVPQPPAAGGSTTPPTTDGAATPPANDPATPPANGGAATPPATDSGTATPPAAAPAQQGVPNSQ
jgi:preprotein translocase subunit SecG